MHGPDMSVYVGNGWFVLSRMVLVWHRYFVHSSFILIHPLKLTAITETMIRLGDLYGNEFLSGPGTLWNRYVSYGSLAKIVACGMQAVGKLRTCATAL